MSSPRRPHTKWVITTHCGTMLEVFDSAFSSEMRVIDSVVGWRRIGVAPRVETFAIIPSGTMKAGTRKIVAGGSVDA